MLPLKPQTFHFPLLVSAILLAATASSCAGSTGKPRAGNSAESEAARDTTSENAKASQPGDSASRPAQASEEPSTSLPGASPSATPDSAASPIKVALPKDSRVLHIGDSFAGALGHALNKELAERGVKGTLKYEKSTYIPTWAWSKELPSHFWRYKPDVVFITLGGNELKIPDPEVRAKTVRRLVSRLGERPCVWIGIPLWEGASPALMGVIERNVAPCLFFDSAALLPDLARAGDGIHPSKSARTRWAKALVDWLQHQLADDGSWRWRAPAAASP